MFKKVLVHTRRGIKFTILFMIAAFLIVGIIAFLYKPTYSVFIKGEQVGYGGLFTAKSDMTVGVLACGNVHGMGITRETKNNPIYDIFKILYRSIKKRYVIFNGGRPVEILGKPNMNVTLINMTGLDKYAKLKIAKNRKDGEYGT